MEQTLLDSATASREDLLGLIEAQAYLAMDSPSFPDGGRLSFPSVNVHDIPVDGIGCHYGIDRTLYYDLYSGERKLISMNDWRLEEFFSETSDGDLRKIHDGIVKGVEKTIGEKSSLSEGRRRSEEQKRVLRPEVRRRIKR